MSFEWFVASRYLRAKGRSRFRALITVLAVGGVTVGVAAAITVLGVMNGFTKEVRDRIVGTNAHIVLLDPSEEGLENVADIQRRVEKFDGVTATAPFVFGRSCAYVRPAVRRRDPPRHGREGRGGRDGRRLADHASRRVVRPSGFQQGQAAGGCAGQGSGAAPARGDRRSGGGHDPGLAGGTIPRMRAFVVTGTFESGIFEYDSALAFTSIDAARDALDTGDRVTGILVRVKQMEEAPAIGQKIMKGISTPALWANDWVRQNKQLFLWMKIEKIVGYLLFAIILVVAAFLIASTLIMIVLEKTREIGVLLSLGAGQRGVRRVFLLEGMAIGGLGIRARLSDRLGNVRGAGPLPPPASGGRRLSSNVPARLWWGKRVLVAGLAFVICLASTIYPSWRASRLVPLEAIRYE